MATREQLQRLAALAPLALACEAATGCPAALQLAQWCFESAWGERAPGNNCFGIKAHSGAAFQLVPSTEWFTKAEVTGFLQHDPRRTAIEKRDAAGNVQKNGTRTLYSTLDAFAAYPTMADCFADHARLLTGGLYEKAWEAFQADGNVERFVRAIGPIYATQPGYAEQMLAQRRAPSIVNALAAARPKVVT